MEVSSMPIFSKWFYPLDFPTKLLYAFIISQRKTAKLSTRVFNYDSEDAVLGF
jgi:hypothetical protein